MIALLPCFTDFIPDNLLKKLFLLFAPNRSAKAVIIC